MEIRFSQEEQLLGNSVKTIIEQAPVATVKVGAGIAKTGVKLGFGLAKSLFTAGKVLVNSATEAYNEYQDASADRICRYDHFSAGTPSKTKEYQSESVDDSNNAG